MIDVAVYGLVNRKGWKHQAFTSSGTFTAPVDGVYFLNGVAGGASGRVGADSADRAGGGSGESVSMMPVYLSAGTAVSITIAAGGTGDGGNGGNTIIGSYLTLYGGGVSGAPNLNYYGGGTINADNLSYGSLPSNYFNHISTDKKKGANASTATSLQASQGNFPNGVKAGTYMWGGAGSKYAAGGAGNASGAGGSGSLGSGGGSGTTAAGPGGDGYLEIMWQE